MLASEKHPYYGPFHWKRLLTHFNYRKTRAKKYWMKLARYSGGNRPSFLSFLRNILYFSSSFSTLRGYITVQWTVYPSVCWWPPPSSYLFMLNVIKKIKYFKNAAKQPTKFKLTPNPQDLWGVFCNFSYINFSFLIGRF